MRWYAKEGPVRDPAAPTVAVLLYRKHVITDQVGLIYVAWPVVPVRPCLYDPCREFWPLPEPVRAANRG